jgi:cytochrome c oxidase subunit II
MREALASGLGAAALALAAVALSVGIGDGSAAPTTAALTEHESGRAVFVRMGCGSCHTLAAAGSAGGIGPNLDERLGEHTRASLIAQITAPRSDSDGFDMMPTDFGSRMSAGELDSLVRFLLAAR